MIYNSNGENSSYQELRKASPRVKKTECKNFYELITLRCSMIFFSNTLLDQKSPKVPSLTKNLKLLKWYKRYHVISRRNNPLPISCIPPPLKSSDSLHRFPHILCAALPSAWNDLPLYISRGDLQTYRSLLKYDISVKPPWSF